MRVGRGHLDRIDHRAAGLLFEILGPAVPELGLVEDGVENRGGVAPAMLPAMTEGGRFGVGAAKPDIVAGAAADGVACGQSRIEIQHLAERDLRRRRRVAGQFRRRGRDRLELLARLRHQIVLRQGGDGKNNAERHQGGDGFGAHGELPSSCLRKSAQSSVAAARAARSRLTPLFALEILRAARKDLPASEHGRDNGSAFAQFRQDHGDQMQHDHADQQVEGKLMRLDERRCGRLASRRRRPCPSDRASTA